MFINQSVSSMSYQSAVSSTSTTKMNCKLIICVIFIQTLVVVVAAGSGGSIINGDSGYIDVGLGSIDHQRWQRIEEDKNGEIQLRHQRHYYNRHHNDNTKNNNPIIEDDDDELSGNHKKNDEEDVTQGYHWYITPATSPALINGQKKSTHHIAIRHHNHHHQYHHRRYQTTATTMTPIVITTTTTTTTPTPPTTTAIPATVAPIFPTEEHRLRHSNKLYQPYALAESTYARSRRQHSTVSPLISHHQTHHTSTKSSQFSSSSPPPHLPWYEPIKRHNNNNNNIPFERTFYNVSNVMRNHYFDESSEITTGGHRLLSDLSPSGTPSKSLSSHLKKRKYRHPYDVLQIPYKDRVPRIKITSFKWDDELTNDDDDDYNDNDEEDDIDNNNYKTNNWKITNIVDKNSYDRDDTNHAVAGGINNDKNNNDNDDMDVDDDNDNGDADTDENNDGDDDEDEEYDNRNKWNKFNDGSTSGNIGYNRKKKASLLLKSSERFGGNGRSGRSRNIFENSGGVNNKNKNNKNNEDDDGYVGDEENQNKRKFSNLGHINRNKYLSRNAADNHDRNDDDENDDDTINEEYSPNDDIGSFTNHKFQMLGNAKAVKDSMTAYRNTQKSKKQEKEFAGQHANRVYMEASCKLPRPRIVPVQSGAAKTYVPHCTILYRCGDDTGCCNTDANTCVARRTEAVDLYFYVTTLNSKSTTIEKQTFVNHTECHCVSKRSQPLHPPPEPLRRATILSCTCPEQFEKILQEDGTCRCDCSTGKFGCEYQKLGKEHFSISDRKCILDGRCKPPTCEYGSYIKRSGKCPMKSDKLMRSFSRRAK